VPRPIQIDPVRSARAAGLRYVTDASPGIRRVRAGRGFSYLDARGRRVTDGPTLARIRSLAIPPAWTSVWICPSARGHLQATGRDARGRKQYRYHPRWAETRDETKYGRMLRFGELLPQIRRAVDEHMAVPGLPREKVLATVVKLMDRKFLRIGNEEYERDNQSFGVTTLRDRHVDISGSRLRFRFKGKSGKEHIVEMTDRRIAAIVKRCRDIPGYRLFQYVGDDGRRHSIGSQDVNRYLREVTGQPFTAKDFRTWAGSVLAARELASMGEFESKTEATRNIVGAIKNVAEELGNTPAVCRKCYVHPEVVEAYLDGSLPEFHRKVTELEPPEELDPEEAAFLLLLRRASSKSKSTAAA
jgi:DNA topoisomerase-1